MTKWIITYFIIAFFVMGFTNSLNKNYCPEKLDCSNFFMEAYFGLGWPIGLVLELIDISFPEIQGDSRWNFHPKGVN